MPNNGGLVEFIGVNCAAKNVVSRRDPLLLEAGNVEPDAANDVIEQEEEHDEPEHSERSLAACSNVQVSDNSIDLSHSDQLEHTEQRQGR